MELAVATNTSPREWWDEDPETVLTAAAVLAANAAEIRKATRGGRHG